MIPLPAVGQSTASVVTGLVLTNGSTASNNPFLWLQDASGDTGGVPLLEVTGGQDASTLGIQVTSQANSTLSTIAPVWSTIMPPGYGGLSLLQTSTATTSGGVGSPTFAMCANQYGGTGSAGPACWWWQVQGGKLRRDLTGMGSMGKDARVTLQIQ
jgi:hypothetical protein